MQLYLVRTVNTEDSNSNYFLIAARDEAEVREICEDGVTRIVELIDNAADIAATIDHDYCGCALLAQV